MKSKKFTKGNLTIKCETDSYYPIQFIITIKDDNGNIVVHNKQKINEYTSYLIEKAGDYQIRISPVSLDYNVKSAYRWIKINPCCNNVQYFKFLKLNKTSKYVIMNFTLTDAKFTNFPIQKGVVYLWQKVLP